MNPTVKELFPREAQGSSEALVVTGALVEEETAS